MTSTTATDSLTANKRLAVRFLDLISDGDIAALAALISPTWTMEGGPPDLPAGRERVNANEAGLADTGLAGDEHDRPRSPRGAVERDIEQPQLVVAFELARRHDHIAPARVTSTGASRGSGRRPRRCGGNRG